MRSPIKNRPHWLALSRALLELGKRLGNWSEGPGLAPRLVHFYLREKSPHGA